MRRISSSRCRRAALAGVCLILLPVPVGAVAAADWPYSDDPVQLAAIEPGAGGQAETRLDGAPLTVETGAEAEAATVTEPVPDNQAAHPVLEEGRAEQELGDIYDTEVSRSAVDRAGETEIVRDRLGEGRLGVFYDHETDRRIQDTQDTIGLDVKIVEFD